MKKSYLLIVGVLIITAIVMVVGWDNVYKIMSRMTLPQFIFLVILQLGTLFLTAYIWYFLLKQKSSQISLFNVFGINLAGTFVESVTPSVKIGGEALKVYLMRQKTALAYSELTAVAVVSKYFSLLPFLLISVITLAIALLAFNLPFFVFIAFIGLLLFFLLFFIFFNIQGFNLDTFFNNLLGEKINNSNNQVLKKIIPIINRIYTFLLDSSNASKSIVTSMKQRKILFLIAFVVWALYPVKVYLVAFMLGYQLNIVVVVLATYTAYLVSMIPLLPGGLATFEGSMALVLAYEGLTSAEAISIALMTRVITFWIPLLLSAIITIYYIKNTDNQEGEII
ncbi:hypothetical protein SYNTR_0750 [Candidatus Syntrophocurvum alkaliphilum]|uniref:Phosphatidylglycerol lysyltransferase n=1 Tax=Candidatus Syntrophocurvum alkaliphilum TaxID=2293317 RepID=A0A6I6DG49_9FIRM|nr:lysylphosphatidylglycerol synthase transmembrane domain-containing protein [Candidatus Syntrophocurvum alkaliphilum]QGT99343.1 hypothetical protein SYNTR_0750 [Candidatus Syntrophocurvum alkaliphilum]